MEKLKMKMRPTLETSLQYFIGHQLIPENIDDLREAISSALGPLGYEPYYAEKTIEGQPLLLKICHKIFTASFCVFDLSLPNPNVYLEMGVALGFNRPVIAIARDKSRIPQVLQGNDIIGYDSYIDLEAKIARLCTQGFPLKQPSEPDYCHFCGKICASMSTPPDENSYLVLNSYKLPWRDLMQVLEPHLADHHLHPVYLTDQTLGPMLCGTRGKILASRFVVCHLGSLSDESSFLALGIAVGSRVPWIILSKRNQEQVPSNLQGFDRIEYATLRELKCDLTGTLDKFVDKIILGTTGNGDTQLISLPFWTQLEDWIDRVTHATQPPEAILGKIRAVQYKGQRFLSKHIVPSQGLLFGRDPECDVVIESQTTSWHHFRILRGRTENCFIEDLGSTNGTFLNGVRLTPHRKEQLQLNDTIRMPGARFVIWDDRPLSSEKTAHIGGTGLLPPIPRIEIPDIPPPVYLNTWDHLVILTVLTPKGERFTFEVQGYYPMGQILSRLAKLLDLPDREYHFHYKNGFIDEDKTPFGIGLKEGAIISIIPEES